MVTARARRLLRKVAIVGTAALSAAFVLPALTGAGSIAASAKGGKSPIRVGYDVALTGLLAANGTTEVDGFKLGLKHFGTKIDGHPIVVKYVDPHDTPTNALAELKLLIHSDHVNVVEGPIASSSIIVTSPYSLSQGIPITDINLSSVAMIANYKKYGMGMTSGWTSYQPATIAGTYGYKTMKLRHVTTVCTDIGFGWQVVGGFAAEFTKLGGKIDKEIWIPTNVSDLSSDISSIPATTQAVYSCLSGTQAADFVDDFKSFGLKAKIPLFGITQTTGQSALPAEKKTAATGVITGAQYCTGIPTKLNQSFANAYHTTTGLWPSYYSEEGYVRAEILDAALKAVHGNVNGTKAEKKLGEAMRNVKITAPRGPVKVTKNLYTVVQNSYICKVETVKGTLRNVPIKTYKNLAPGGVLSEATFMKQFTQQSTGRPTFVNAS